MRIRTMRELSIGFPTSGASMKRIELDGFERDKSTGRDTMLALLLFGLIREWLVPILYFSNVNGLREQLPFFIVISAVLLLDLLRIPQLLSWPVKLALVWTAVYWAVVAGGVATTDQPFLSAFVLGIAHDAKLMLGGDPGAAGPYSRTFLFLLGWSMLTSVLYALMQHVRSGLWFVALTLIFLISLQYGTGENMTDSIIRTLFLGLFLLSLQRFSGLMEKVPGNGVAPGASGWWAAALVLAGCAVVFGWLAAGSESREVQPLSWDNLPKPLEAWVSRWQEISGGGLSASATEHGFSRLAATGYGEDDTHLGGPLKQDEQVAFMAKTPELTYWRGESKDTYDGKGWRSSQGALGSGHPAVSVKNPTVAKTITQEIVPASDAVRGQLFAGGHIAAIDTIISDKGQVIPGETVYIDPITGKALVDTAAGKLTYYKLEVIPSEEQVRSGSVNQQLPALSNGGVVSSEEQVRSGSVNQQLPALSNGGVVSSGEQVRNGSVNQQFPALNDAEVIPSEEQVRSGSVNQQLPALSNAEVVSTGEQAGNSSGDRLDALGKMEATSSVGQTRNSSGNRPEALVDASMYLQLPEHLPERIQQLAQELTEGLANPVDKAKAIEQYLDEHYRYSLSEPDWPGKDADFVDHFLFEQKVGYCDHFSTAMTVMLRTIGMPARWVKGYAPGQLNLSAGSAASANGQQLYAVTVRNLDAHSWVELWVPEKGWVPFDPTPGFPGMGSEQLNSTTAVNSGIAAGERALSDKTVLSPSLAPSASPAGVDRGDSRQSQLSKVWSLPDVSKSLAKVSRFFTFPLVLSLVCVPMVCWTAWYAWRAGQARLHPPHWFVLRGLQRGRWQHRSQTRVLIRIWRRVERVHGVMSPNQTYREYVQNVHMIDEDTCAALLELAYLTEKVFYDTSGLPFWIPRRHLSRIWLQLLHPSRKSEAAIPHTDPPGGGATTS